MYGNPVRLFCSVAMLACFEHFQSARIMSKSTVKKRREYTSYKYPLSKIIAPQRLLFPFVAWQGPRSIAAEYSPLPFSGLMD